MPGTPIVKKNRRFTDNHPDHLLKEGNEHCKEFTESEGTVYLGSGAILRARYIGLRTIATLLFTVQGGSTDSYYATFWIWEPKRFDNYATVWIWDGNAPSEVTGSVYLCYRATGE